MPRLHAFLDQVIICPDRSDKGEPVMNKVACQPPQISQPATIHCTELSEANTGEPLYLEWNTYRREVGRLLAEGHEGQYTLIKNDTVLGVYACETAALAEGFKRFPGQTFLVHQIREMEPILRIRGHGL
jgi:hypothetical protein